MQRCPNCQSPIPPRASFCRQCGQAILSEAKDDAKQPEAIKRPEAGSGNATMAEGFTVPTPPPQRGGANATMMDTGSGAATLPPGGFGGSNSNDGSNDSGESGPDYEGGGAT